MTSQRRTVTAIAIVAIVVTVVVALLAVGVIRPFANNGTTTATPASPNPAAKSANVLGAEFLHDWVSGGRVIRKDQGSDTVSEGQAYGMLIAAGIGDESSFNSIWQWTRTHLKRNDGLLAWRWADGKVVDTQPASDGDLDTARALIVAGDRFDRPDLTSAGKRLAMVIADKLTVQTSLGRILLPGLWAAHSDPYAYNPSYASPVAFSVLGKATGDPRWAELATGAEAVTTRLLDISALPPDWASVSSTGQVADMPGANGSSGSVVYGYDAARVSLWYAESCSATDVALAARMTPTLSRDMPLPAVLDLGGGPQTTDQHPIAYAARAAAESAAGQTANASADLIRAQNLSTTTPTYYGRAWTDLSMILLRTTHLGGCAPLAATPSASAEGKSK